MLYILSSKEKNRNSEKNLKNIQNSYSRIVSWKAETKKLKGTLTTDKVCAFILDQRLLGNDHFPEDHEFGACYDIVGGLEEEL